jgi:hypothetical protein
MSSATNNLLDFQDYDDFANSPINSPNLAKRAQQDGNNFFVFIHNFSKYLI